MTLDLYEGRYETALGHCSSEDIVDLGKFYRAEIHLMAALAHELLGQSLASRQQAETSRSLLEERLEELPENAFLRGRLALTYAFLGRKEDAIELGRSVAQAEAGDAFSGPRFMEDLARIFLRNGQLDQSVELLEKLMSIPYQQALGRNQLALDPIWEPLSREPRFRALARPTG
jgi:tetratricopeptide (TPR) repeat protein